MIETPEWAKVLYSFSDGAIPYYVARLECKNCNKLFLITISDQNKDFVPSCFNCQSVNTNKVIFQKLNSYCSVKES